MGCRTGWLQGIFPALVTPFTADDRLDEQALRELLRSLLPHVDGVVPCGTTGEAPYLSLEERKRLIELCLEEVDGRVPVLAGTGVPSTRETVALTRWARDAGATGALVVAPYYLKPDYNEVYEHYRAVDAVGLPVVIYNMPQCTGSSLEWWTAEGSLLDFENTVGLKDSSGDMAFLGAMLEKVRGRVSLMVGHDEIVQPALGAGLDGAILASANLIPEQWQKLLAATRKQDLPAAQAVQQRVQKLARLVTRRGATQACKEGLHMLGLEVGQPRHPLMPGGLFRREDREELRLQLEALGRIESRPVTYEANGRSVTSELPATPDTPAVIRDFTLKVGEGFAGPPLQELAHIDLLIGMADGPVGRAIDRALQADKPRPGMTLLCERPRTLLVPTITIRNERQRALFERAAAGVKHAIDQSIDDGFLPAELLDELVLIINAFVHSAAAIGYRVEFNNAKATRHALRKALEGRPHVDELVSEQAAARHPFRYAP